MTSLAIAIIVGLLGLCWFLHTITWPLVRLVQAEWWHRALEFGSALAFGGLGAAAGYVAGRELSGTIAAIIAAPPTAYAVFLAFTCLAYAREFVALPVMIERPRWIDTWERAKITTKSYLRHTPAAIIAILIVPSIIVAAIGISWGSPARGMFLALVLWFMISQFGGLVHEVRWFGANRARLQETGSYPFWLNPPPPDNGSLRARVRRAVWGF